ncbi:6383_t:CDS:2 [Funneliformis caledonium]|uniref:Signal peptidase complex catalytic subunit SEC11 n=2 Tax=Funneliformis TaxID=1117308 RepID=A0A9N8ZGK9_9GLOM|nr:6383_t:CDS:2 [Funneliformis caledonium]CAG8563585.1 5004_t:CDS:2 [Funneliformis mosseae]
MFEEEIRFLRKMNKRQLAQQVLNFLMIISSALMVWKALALYTNSESPIVVVLSGSMEPAFYRGDLLFLGMPDEPLRVGDICVFKIPGRDVPIVHRVIKLHDEKESEKQFILTKGDNNQVDDRGLYNKGQLWIHREHIIGKVRGFLPYIGIITILMNDYPQLKYVLIGFLGLYMLVNRE